MKILTLYVASSFKHLHAVQLLTRELKKQGYQVEDWTEKATPPEGLTPAQRRDWMDTDHGGQVFNFCAKACETADMVIYLGMAGQGAGVEIGMAHGAGKPVLGIRGPLESPGLMLHGAVTGWTETVEHALHVTAALMKNTRASEQPLTASELRDQLYNLTHRP